MLTPTPSRPFSAETEMTLEVGGRRLPVAKSSPERLTLVSPTSLAPGRGRLHVTIDGNAHARDVWLPFGSDGTTPFVAITSPQAAAVNA
ncbi:MAG: hypothetical protein ACK5Q5_12700 [Planctomycetaceae bacterium]